MKWAGITIIFLSCSGGGIWASLILEKRKRQISTLRRAILFLNREIDYRLTPLSEAFLAVGNSCEKPWDSFFLHLGETLGKEMEEGKDFSFLLSEAVENAIKFHPWKEDLSFLKSSLLSLGQLDKQMQLSSLKLLEEALAEAEQKAETERQQKGKLYRTLGLCFGFLLVLMCL